MSKATHNGTCGNEQAVKSNFTEYEWDYELWQCSDDGEIEILDHYHWNHCRGLPDGSPDEDGELTKLVLVKDVYRDWSLVERTWAYVDGGKLPDFFSDAYLDEADKVPQRFHKELAKFTP